MCPLLVMKNRLDNNVINFSKYRHSLSLRNRVSISRQPDLLNGCQVCTENLVLPQGVVNNPSKVKADAPLKTHRSSGNILSLVPCQVDYHWIITISQSLACAQEAIDEHIGFCIVIKSLNYFILSG